MQLDKEILDTLDDALHEFWISAYSTTNYREQDIKRHAKAVAWLKEMKDRHESYNDSLSTGSTSAL